MYMGTGIYLGRAGQPGMRWTTASWRDERRGAPGQPQLQLPTRDGHKHLYRSTYSSTAQCKSMFFKQCEVTWTVENSKGAFAIKFNAMKLTILKTTILWEYALFILHAQQGRELSTWWKDRTRKVARKILWCFAFYVHNFSTRMALISWLRKS